MVTAYKSKAMQQLAARRQDQATALYKKTVTDVLRAKQKLEELLGERGQNRAVRRADFKKIASVKLQSDAYGVSLETLAADMKAIHGALIDISNILGTSK